MTPRCIARMEAVGLEYCTPMRFSRSCLPPKPGKAAPNGPPGIAGPAGGKRIGLTRVSPVGYAYFPVRIVRSLSPVRRNLDALRRRPEIKPALSPSTSLGLYAPSGAPRGQTAKGGGGTATAEATGGSRPGTPARDAAWSALPYRS